MVVLVYYLEANILIEKNYKLIINIYFKILNKSLTN